MKLIFPTVIDNSLRSAWVRCPTLARWRYFAQLSSTGAKSSHLVCGHAFAKGIETVRRAFYQHGKSPEDAAALGLEALIKDYGDHEPHQVGTQGYKTCFNAARALETYFLQWPLGYSDFHPYQAPGCAPAIEFTFAIPLPITHPDTGEPLLAAGRSDALMIHPHMEGVWPFDEKTTYGIGDQWAAQWEMDSQIPMYAWAAREHGYDVRGGVIRGIGLQTKQIKLASAPIHCSSFSINRWYTQFLRDVEDMRTAYIQLTKEGRHGAFRMALDKFVCRDCEFSLLCDAVNPYSWIEGNYFHREWSPLGPSED